MLKTDREKCKRGIWNGRRDTCKGDGLSPMSRLSLSLLGWGAHVPDGANSRPPCSSKLCSTLLKYEFREERRDFRDLLVLQRIRGIEFYVHQALVYYLRAWDQSQMTFHEQFVLFLPEKIEDASREIYLNEPIRSMYYLDLGIGHVNSMEFSALVILRGNQWGHRKMWAVFSG